MQQPEPPALIAEDYEILVEKPHRHRQVLEFRGQHEGIVLAFHRMSRTPRPSLTTPDLASVEWEVYHRRFHASLIAACGSRWLLAFAEMLFEGAERYRHLSRGARAPARDPMIEHRVIMEATLGRDRATAIELLNNHAHRTVEIILGSGTSFPAALSPGKRVSPRSR